MGRLDLYDLVTAIENDLSEITNNENKLIIMRIKTKLLEIKNLFLDDWK